MTPRSFRVRGMGLELAVLEWARPESERVCVLLHGFQDCAASWDLVAPAIVARGFRVIAPDLRGFGDSGRVAASGYYHFPDYVFDLVELVDAVSKDAPIALVGHSMGGTLASMWAGAFPERVAKLVLLEGVGPPQMPDELAVDRVRAWIEGVRRVRARDERPMPFDEAVRRLSMNHPHVPRDLLRRRAEQLTRPAGEGLVSWAFDPLHRTRAPIGFSTARWMAHARKITADTLCVGGGKAGFHPEDEAERIAAIPRARAVEIDDAGHMMHWTRPEQVARLIVEHVDG